MRSNSATQPVLASDITVMVVDDDPLVRSLIARTLSNHGYNVIEAESGLEAQGIAARNQPIHLVLTDLRMPVMDGLELIGWFQKEHAQIKMLLVSGSLCDLLNQKTALPLPVPYLAKPFRANELLDKVQQILGLPLTSSVAD